MFTVWPWPGRDRLAPSRSRLQLELVVAQERDPGRVRLALLGEDHARHRQADDDEGEDRHEVAQVFPDRAPHGDWRQVGGPAAAAGPLRLGTAFSWHGTSMWNGRRRLGQDRLDPVGGLDRVPEVRGVLEAAGGVRRLDELVAARLEAQDGPLPSNGAPAPAS